MSNDIKYETVWSPKPDISAFELAQCIPYIPSRFQEIEDWDTVDESITRHFQVKKFDYGDMIAGNAAKLKALFDE
jgi:hypothetical protein